MAKENTWKWILAVIVIFGVGFYFNIGGLQDKISGEKAPVLPGEDECIKVESTVLTIGPAEEKFNPATKLTTAYHRFIRNGIDEGLVIDKTTKTVNPGDKVEIIYGENSSTHYAGKQSFTIPCKGEVTTGSMPDSQAYQLYANGSSFTFRVTNEDDNLVNSNSNDQTLGAGDVKTLALTMVGIYEDAYSPYGKICMVIEGNQSVFDDVIVGSFPKGCLPAQHTVSATSNSVWSYELPGLISNSEISTNVVIDADDTNNPADGQDLTVTFYDQDYFQNTNSGNMEFGYENDQNSDVGTTNPTQTIYVS